MSPFPAKAPRASRPRRPTGFTLIELLVVIAIILALAVAVVPNIGVGISGTQLSTASRSVVQAARYARTMAILHQTETELVLVSAPAEGVHSARLDGGDGAATGGARIEVRVAHARGGGQGPQGGEQESSGKEQSEGEAEAEDAGAGIGDGLAEAGDGAASTGEALGEFAEQVHSVFPCGATYFEFVGFTDDEDDATPSPAAEWRGSGDGRGEEDDEAARTLAFRFDSDGTCRPFEVVLRDTPGAAGDGGMSMKISVDAWGRGRIEGRDDD